VQHIDWDAHFRTRVVCDHCGGRHASHVCSGSAQQRTRIRR
jgi:hypothetical protein